MPKKKKTTKKLGRDERRDLDVEISFLEGLVRRDTQYTEALELLGDDYTKRGRYRDGLEIDLALSKLRPEDPMVFYNLACSYSLTNHYEEALDALEKAFKCGYDDFYWLARDPDLQNIRELPRFQKLKERYRPVKSRKR
ncbi:MAG: hypothetical protein K9N48_02965 [Verrucomicrobia bacterium]|nr:hypothetical protein [Verrucomicrobiota bacterium]MCF7709429.1 hypothetical protein [Verrucomicrobiota bacterium]